MSKYSKMVEFEFAKANVCPHDKKEKYHKKRNEKK